MSFCRGAVALFVTLMLTACFSFHGEEESLFEGGKTYYLDSNLGFTWAYPASWERSAGQSRQSVRWNAFVADESEPAIQVEITALLPSQLEGGADALLNHFTLSHPNFNLTADTQIELIDGLPARELLGHSPARSFLVGLVMSHRHAFILVFSLPPEHFNSHLPLFREMCKFFKPID